MMLFQDLEFMDTTIEKGGLEMSLIGPSNQFTPTRTEMAGMAIEKNSVIFFSDIKWYVGSQY